MREIQTVSAMSICERAAIMDRFAFSSGSWRGFINSLFKNDYSKYTIDDGDQRSVLD